MLPIFALTGFLYLVAGIYIAHNARKALGLCAFETLKLVFTGPLEYVRSWLG